MLVTAGNMGTASSHAGAAHRGQASVLARPRPYRGVWPSAPHTGGSAVMRLTRRADTVEDVPHADRRRPPVRLRALRAPARPAAVRPLALGALARRDDGGRRLAPLAPAGGPRPATARGRV